MDEATKRQLTRILGANRELPPYPTVTQATKFLVHAPDAHNATAGTDSLHIALDMAWDAFKMGECPAYVWDLRGDGADHDPTAEPRLLAVVGVFYLDGE